MQKIHAAAARVADFFRAVSALFYRAPIRFTVISCFILNIIIEALCRHSLIEAFRFLFTHPFMFAVGWIILLFTCSFSWFMTKGLIMWLTATVVWLGFSIANSVILLYRAAPLTGSDFAILGDVLPIITVYLNVFQIILISVAIVGAVTGLVFLFIKAPASKVNIKRQLIKFGGFTVSLAILVPTLALTGVLPRSFSDINRAYKNYGFPYGFLCSIFVQGISEPSDYGKAEIDELINRVENQKKPSDSGENAVKPNVIYVQLESFFDLNLVKWLETSEDPSPNFTALKNSYPHGYLNVPLVGAGTANSEFEILTGMNLDYFGAGEYPYTTVLDERTCESVAYAFGNYGYKTHAMHNNTGTFYLRDVVYANLGFDTFSPLENMYGVEYNELEWATDACLFPQIKETLLSTSERDFVFTVSVQAHGKYPEMILGDGYKLGAEDVSGIEDEKLLNMYLYYIEQVRGTDEFIGELIRWLEDFEEPTAVVFYGDHLPYLELTDEDVVNGDLYQTEYILYTNYNIGEVKTETIEAYQLNSFVFDALGMDGGIMCDVHKYLSDEEDYLEVLKTLEYDMLFGEQYAYGEKGAYPRKDMRFGIREVILSDISYIRTGESGERCVLTVYGVNFNEFSAIQVNGKTVDNIQFISDTEMKVTLKELNVGDKITVVQQADDGTVFNTTAEIEVKS